MRTNFYTILKRVFDVVFSATALIVLSPLLVLVAIILKLESKGPILYTSKRIGSYYKSFDLFKFRTMAVDADANLELMKKLNLYKPVANVPLERTEECPFCKMLARPCSPLLQSDEGVICDNFYNMTKGKGAFYKINNDPRVTRFGKFLRRSSIDELPQLLNVIKGDMSLIGNRPLPLYEAEKLTTDFAVERFNSPAGLTGLWQVTQRGKKDVSELDRINLDKVYARTWSFKTDLKIFLKTFPALIQQENV